MSPSGFTGKEPVFTTILSIGVDYGDGLDGKAGKYRKSDDTHVLKFKK